MVCVCRTLFPSVHVLIYRDSCQVGASYVDGSALVASRLHTGLFSSHMTKVIVHSIGADGFDFCVRLDNDLTLPRGRGNNIQLPGPELTRVRHQRAALRGPRCTSSRVSTCAASSWSSATCRRRWPSWLLKPSTPIHREALCYLYYELNAQFAASALETGKLSVHAAKIRQ